MRNCGCVAKPSVRESQQLEGGEFLRLTSGKLTLLDRGIVQNRRGANYLGHLAYSVKSAGLNTRFVR